MGALGAHGQGALIGNELGASLAASMGIKLDLTVPQSPPATLLVASRYVRVPEPKL